ncbi:DivIVA domain-containing protein [Nonomuraea thailandensis]|uniref:DivIVA domain-containing protein n=1 Tax=Nonomuraea thailandensis TaxID=1188745 RepID=A0A9X2GM24_9ACTN|nr:DivIVA domain-containing protein [Nonomuraea thailandensis]MCP2358036.1 DivIVA domain-containing protein [Nonomuraea thailandensis]
MDDQLPWPFAEPRPGYEFDVVIRGYDPHQVHELLIRVEKTLDGTAAERIEADDVGGAVLKVRLRGYHRGQVDAALADCARRLRES